MSKYIDANKLVETLNEMQDDINPNNYYEGLGLAKKIVSEMPTEDVAPVKHASWLDHVILGELVYGCSMCGRIKRFRTCYCSSCGAKMDGKENEE